MEIRGRIFCKLGITGQKRQGMSGDNRHTRIYINYIFDWIIYSSLKARHMEELDKDFTKKFINEISLTTTSSELRPIAVGVGRCSSVIVGMVCSDS